MSVYSLDSLDDINDCSSKDSLHSNSDSDKHNQQRLGSFKVTLARGIEHNSKRNTRAVKKIKSRTRDSLGKDIRQDTPSYHRFVQTIGEDTRSNETLPSTAMVQSGKILCVRNAIITGVEFAVASPSESTVCSSKIQKRQDVPESLTKNARSKRNERIRLELEKSTSTEQSQKKTSSLQQDRFSHHLPCLRYEGAQGISCREDNTVQNNTMPMKSNKKLGNVLPPNIPPAKKPHSYLELYRRRFSVPQCSIRSPVSSTLSICGDSQPEQLTEDDARSSLPTTSREDQSELSFYRRLIDRIDNRLPMPTQFFETQNPPIFKAASSLPCFDKDKSNVSNDKPTRKPSYRPYTIEEYRNLPIPKPDRSLGPDKVEIQAKREWLMRRRSYGNSVSARNRQRILLHAQNLKIRCGDADKNFLPSLNNEIEKKQTPKKSGHEAANTKTVSEPPRIKSSKTFPRGTTNPSTRTSQPKAVTLKKTTTWEKSLFPSENSSSSDIYLNYLNQRHYQEKEVVSRIISQTLQT